MFVDEVHITVHGGHGGPGLVAWRREKFIAFGGPTGGDGGGGGSVIIVADINLGTLMDLRYKRHVRAEKGKQGGGNRMTGRSGEDAIVPVPIGTQVFNAETDELLCDLVEDGQRFVVAEGGRGGQGNFRFVSSTNRSPRFAQPGTPGGELSLRLELKLLAEVGIIGYPSVGKSTLITAISNARPKIASYPFTTLAPNLGMVQWGDESFAVADIPGLIEGASEGLGLGHQFLRHVERCRLLVHMIEVSPPFGYTDAMDYTDREPVADFERICRELTTFNPEMADREQIVVLNKMDLPHTQEHEAALKAHFEGLGMTFLSISAAAHMGLKPLLNAIGQRVLADRAVEAEAREEEARAKKGIDALLDVDADALLDKAVERGVGASGLGRHTESETDPSQT